MIEDLWRKSNIFDDFWQKVIGINLHHYNLWFSKILENIEHVLKFSDNIRKNVFMDSRPYWELHAKRSFPPIASIVIWSNYEFIATLAEELNKIWTCSDKDTLWAKQIYVVHLIKWCNITLKSPVCSLYKKKELMENMHLAIFFHYTMRKTFKISGKKERIWCEDESTNYRWDPNSIWFALVFDIITLKDKTNFNLCV